MNKSIIPIFYTINDEYAKYVATSIKSLLSNASPNYHYNIHVIYEDISPKNKAILESLATENSTIILDLMAEDLKMIDDSIGNRLRADIFTLTIYFRIFIPLLYPQYDKCIYIDSDTVVVQDISQLFFEDIGDNYFGCVIDKSTIDNEILANYFEQVVGIPRDKYINSGMLLLNSQKLREKHFEQKFLYLFNKYHFDVIAPDQDYINSMCYGHIKYLNDKYDAMPNPNSPEQSNPVIVHYNLFQKPWHYDHVQYEDYFWHYAQMTPYYEEIKNIKANYTAEDKQLDDEHMDLMLKRAQTLINEEITMAKVFGSGLEERL